MGRKYGWQRIRKLAYERDARNNAVCHICEQPIDYHVPPNTTPDSYEADHIVPVSMDSSKELDLLNIKASHMRCNRSRGNGTNGENVIGARSRIW